MVPGDRFSAVAGVLAVRSLTLDIAARRKGQAVAVLLGGADLRAVIRPGLAVERR